MPNWPACSENSGVNGDYLACEGAAELRCRHNFPRGNGIAHLCSLDRLMPGFSKGLDRLLHPIVLDQNIVGIEGGEREDWNGAL